LKFALIILLLLNETQGSINTSSDEVSLDTKENICTLKGNAKVSYITQTENYVFTADRIIISYYKKNIEKIKADGKVVFTYLDLKNPQNAAQKNSHIFTSNRITVLCDGKNIKKIRADGMVTFTHDKLQISSKICTFDTSRCVIFSDEVVITDNKIGTIRADKAVYNIDTKNIDVMSKDKVNIVIENEKI
jgi:lipopolysaccharide export system protein LptA